MDDFLDSIGLSHLSETHKQEIVEFFKQSLSDAKSAGQSQERAQEQVSQLIQELFSVPDTTEQALQAATLAYQNGLVTRATELAVKTLELATTPNETTEATDHAITLAEECFDKENFVHAAPLFERLALHPTTPTSKKSILLRNAGKCHANRAITLAALGRCQDALTSYDHALTLFAGLEGTEHETALCHMNRANTLATLGRYQDALTSYDHALTLYAGLEGTQHNTADCHMNRALTLGELGRCQDALTGYDHALTLFAGLEGTEHSTANCHMNRANALGALGRYQDALTNYDHALTLFAELEGTEHSTARCHSDRANVLEKLGRREEALAGYDHALALYAGLEGTEHGTSTALTNRANSLLSLARYSEALSTFDYASKLSMQDERLINFLVRKAVDRAEFLDSSNNFDEAFEAYGFALTVFQGFGNNEVFSDWTSSMCNQMTQGLGTPDNSPREHLTLLGETKDNQTAIFKAWSVAQRALCKLTISPNSDAKEILYDVVPAALYLDATRYSLKNAEERRRVSQKIGTVFNIAFEAAKKVGDRRLIADLITACRISGTHATENNTNPGNPLGQLYNTTPPTGPTQHPDQPPPPSFSAGAAGAALSGADLPLRPTPWITTGNRITLHHEIHAAAQQYNTTTTKLRAPTQTTL